jgi:ribose transport system ATP-binding protein
MFTVDSIEPDYFTQEHVRLVVPFANQVAAALENAQLYEQARQDAKTKATLLKEVNHWVKNNLSAIIGLLYAERRHAGIKDDDVYQGIMNGLINRIRGLASVHNMLSASEWSPLRLSEMTTQLINTSLQMLPRDKRAVVSVTPSDVLVNAKQANNLALAINELATNTIKHATIDRTSVSITVAIEYADNQITLIYKDDGPGYPNAVLNRRHTHLGLYLVETLITGGMRGQILLSNSNGAETVIKFGADS